MSWSIAFIGKPENIVKALDGYSATLNGQSKTEYDAALPHLVGLVNQNYNSNPESSITLKVTASGHGYHQTTPSPTNYGYCSVTVEQVPGQLV